MRPNYPQAVVGLFAITIPHLSEAAKAFWNYLSFLVQQDLCNVWHVLNQKWLYKKIEVNFLCH